MTKTQEIRRGVLALVATALFSPSFFVGGGGQVQAATHDYVDRVIFRSGIEAHGIACRPSHNHTGDVTINVTGGSITTTGHFSHGIYVFRQSSGMLQVSSGTDITASGGNSSGIFLYAPGTGGYLLDVTAGTIISGSSSGFTTGAINTYSPARGIINIAEGVTINGSASGIAIVESDPLDSGSGAGEMVVTSAGTVFGNTIMGGNDDVFNLTGGRYAGRIYGDHSSTRDDDGDDAFNWSGGALNNGFYGGNGSDTVTISGAAAYDGSAIMNGGDNYSSDDGWIDTLTFQGITTTATGANIINWEIVTIDGATISFTDHMLTAGDGGAGTGLNLINGGTLNAAGDFTLTGNMTNDGIISTRNGATGDTVTIQGDYSGNGQLEVDTDFTADTSDTLVVQGDISGGSTTIVVNDVSTGKPTFNEVLVVDVAGTTADGDFMVAGGGAAAGAYLCNLNLVGQKWYLQPTELLGQTDGYRVLPSVFGHTIGTLRQRKNRINITEESGSGGADTWIRVAGRNRHITPDSGVGYKENRRSLQGGIDTEVSVNDNSRWLLGINAHVGNSDTRVNSAIGTSTANIDNDFYGMGLLATWYGPNGFYADLVGQATWYEADFRAQRTRSSIDATNYAISAEVGKSYQWTQNINLVPQMQLIWSNADFDTFIDDDGVTVSAQESDSFTGRLGLMMERKGANQPNGEPGKNSSYVVANFYQNFASDTAVDASGTTLTYGPHDNWLEVGAGGTFALNKSIDFYGEIDLRTPLDGFGDSYDLYGTVGIRARF